MPRAPRFDLPDHVQHLIHRGNDRRRVFHDDRDRRRFLGLLAAAATDHGLAVHAYVLMPNHVHLLATPTAAGAAGLTMQTLGRRFVPWFNRRHERTGALWEGRYRSCLIDSARYFLTCCRYIELNPVRAGLVRAPEEFAWSSHPANALGRADPLVRPHPLLDALGADGPDRRAAYRALFAVPLGERSLTAIRRAAHAGGVLGDEAFQDRVAAAARLGRPEGRPGSDPGV